MSNKITRGQFLGLLLSPLLAPFIPKKEVTTVVFPNRSKILFNSHVTDASHYYGMNEEFRRKWRDGYWLPFNGDDGYDGLAKFKGQS